jgi:hypothetical protein
LNTQIKRYTNLASLIDILTNKRLTLLDPSKWEDQNDAYYLKRYKDSMGFETLYALCFTKAAETAHHWKAFAPGTDGVCIIMDSDKFLAHLAIHRNIKHGDIKYKLINEVEAEIITLDKLPFLKRYAFRDELEYRIFLGKKEKRDNNLYYIDFDISLIDKIVLSNVLHNNLRKPLVDLIRRIDGCKKLVINRSTLNENRRWKRACDRV